MTNNEFQYIKTTQYYIIKKCLIDVYYFFNKL